MGSYIVRFLKQKKKEKRKEQQIYTCTFYSGLQSEAPLRGTAEVVILQLSKYHMVGLALLSSSLSQAQL